MAGFDIELNFSSLNAMELVDLAYVRPGKKIEFPRLRQIDDRLAPIVFIEEPIESAKDEIKPILEHMEETVQRASADLTELNLNVQTLFKSDLLYSSALTSKSTQHKVRFHGKTSMSGAMLRVIKLYDEVMAQVLLLKNSGFFIGSNQDRKLMNRAGNIVRRMMNDMNAVCIRFNKKDHLQEA